MNKKFSELVNKTMSPGSQEHARRKTETMLAEMALDELRTALSLTQERLAQNLGVKQPSLSKIIRGQDMYISTLDKLIKGMGGDLELYVVLSNGRVKLSLNQFREIAGGTKKTARKAAKTKNTTRKAG
jgi:transcriptional regulator with XRE-family HTH domain